MSSDNVCFSDVQGLCLHCSFVQDVQYGDIDYMERQLDFTYDKANFAGLPEYIKKLKNDGMHYVIILVNFFEDQTYNI